MLVAEILPIDVNYINYLNTLNTLQWSFFQQTREIISITNLLKPNSNADVDLNSRTVVCNIFNLIVHPLCHEYKNNSLLAVCFSDPLKIEKIKRCVNLNITCLS